jgi:uncharacterized protein
MGGAAVTAGADAGIVAAGATSAQSAGGQTRRLRTYDGVYFTKAGAEKLGHYVEHELRRVLSSPVMPVALPGPEEQSPAKDAVGPVLPLDAIGTEKSGELLGAAKQPAGREADPLATRVLNRGEATVAPRGRADDFPWPRPDDSGAADREPAPDAVRPRGAIGTREGGSELVALARQLHANPTGRSPSLRTIAAELAARGFITPSGASMLTE